MIRIACALLLATPCAAEKGRVGAILPEALAECRADVAQDPASPVPDLEIGRAAVTWVDLQGDGEANDAVVDFNHVYCGLNYSLWHGTGGSIVHLVLDDAVSQTWSGGAWRITEFGGAPLVLLGRHGSACDGYGAQPCVQAIAATPGGFSTVRFPQAKDE